MRILALHWETRLTSFLELVETFLIILNDSELRISHEGSPGVQIWKYKMLVGYQCSAPRLFSVFNPNKLKHHFCLSPQLGMQIWYFRSHNVCSHLVKRIALPTWKSREEFTSVQFRKERGLSLWDSGLYFVRCPVSFAKQGSFFTVHNFMFLHSESFSLSFVT